MTEYKEKTITEYKEKPITEWKDKNITVPVTEVSSFLTLERP